MMDDRRATGTFEVTMESQGAPDTTAGTSLGRIRLTKRFDGDLVGEGSGQMLTAMTSTSGSAGYVAIECVTGTLHGRCGSFALQHSGTMHRGAQQLAISVVPDSGTGALAGITGTLGIEIADGVHRYRFDYTLPASTGSRDPAR